jgi:hypothetical protein
MQVISAVGHLSFYYSYAGCLTFYLFPFSYYLLKSKFVLVLFLVMQRFIYSVNICLVLRINNYRLIIGINSRAQLQSGLLGPMVNSTFASKSSCLL